MLLPARLLRIVCKMYWYGRRTYLARCLLSVHGSVSYLLVVLCSLLISVFHTSEHDLVFGSKCTLDVHIMSEKHSLLASISSRLKSTARCIKLISRRSKYFSSEYH
jgi:hypothetical protein